MRRLVFTAAVLASSVSGTLAAFVPAAHASGACVNVHLNVNGQDLVNQQQCVEAPQ